MANSIFDKYFISHQVTKTYLKLFNFEVFDLQVSSHIILAKVKDKQVYSIEIEYDENALMKAECTCESTIVCNHLLRIFDFVNQNYEMFSGRLREKQDNAIMQVEGSNFEIAYSPENILIIQHIDWSQIDDRLLEHLDSQVNLPGKFELDLYYNPTIQSQVVIVNTTGKNGYANQIVQYDEENRLLAIKCSCRKGKDQRCVHMVGALRYVVNSDYGIFMDSTLRKQYLLNSVEKFGFTSSDNLEDFFEIKITRKGIQVMQKDENLFLFDGSNAELSKELVLPKETSLKALAKSQISIETKKGFVFSESRYSVRSIITPFSAGISKAGTIKNPLNNLDFGKEMEKATSSEEFKFLSMMALFKTPESQSNDLMERLKAIRAIMKNPMDYLMYYQPDAYPAKPTLNNVEVLVFAKNQQMQFSIDVLKRENQFTVTPFLKIGERRIQMSESRFKFGYFIVVYGEFYLIPDDFHEKLYAFFKKYAFKLFIPERSFDGFKVNYLDKIESKIEINYSFVKKALVEEIESLNFEISSPKKRIYLSESEGYIQITPAINYGPTEVSVFDARQLQVKGKDNEWYKLDRDSRMEDEFAQLILTQHPYFEEQHGQFDFFYLSKAEFLESGWFIDAFELWKEQEIEVLGFKELKTKINPGKMKVTIKVSNDSDWFDTKVKVKIGNEEIGLKQIQKTLKNNSRYVTLGDGSLGLIPEEWIAKFSKYFRAGTVTADGIKTSKINYSLVEELYEAEQLEESTEIELHHIKRKIKEFKQIESLEIPKKLKAELRPYQKEGLNWLNFLDEFQFGGCLADDMGLGKTVQIIAFILSQIEKGNKLPNLVVVPTSLIFNWQREVEKFAPSLKLHAHYGPNRVKKSAAFKGNNIILTSYGTIISDITFLKAESFNYIFLDESQAIKNPDSQRFKAATLLKARNRVVLTGTPIENNTFDLYAQMTFANPGLFGSQQRFKDDYSTPIDKYQDRVRAKELQERINPFLLRRTKKQVAKDLPDKTEMILYCEMGEEQRQIYNTYRQEIRSLLMDKEQKDKSMLVLKGLTKLRQICDSPVLLSEDVGFDQVSAKITVLLEEIEERVSQHKILVFSQFVGMLDLVREQLNKREIPHEYLTGQTKDRQDRVESFQNDAEKRVFLISLKAGGTGLNLTEADYVYLIDPWWNPAVENQAIDRCYRIGQKKNVVAVRLITPDTIEDKIVDLQLRKKDLANDLIQTDASVYKSLSPDDLLNLLG